MTCAFFGSDCAPFEVYRLTKKLMIHLIKIKIKSHASHRLHEGFIHVLDPYQIKCPPITSISNTSATSKHYNTNVSNTYRICNQTWKFIIAMSCLVLLGHKLSSFLNLGTFCLAKIYTDKCEVTQFPNHRYLQWSFQFF